MTCSANKTSHHSMAFRFRVAFALLLAVLSFPICPVSALAQKSSSAVNAVELDKKVEDAATAFMKTAAEVALDYEKAGELEKAQSVLRKILALQPDLAKVRAKIKELEETRLAEKEASLELDPSRGWASAGVGVKKGSKVRFVSEGECRVIISQRIDSQGFPSQDVKQDLAAGVPLGALMGIVVNRKGKTGKPFLIGKKNEVTVDQEGQLLVRVNVPPGSKCTGKIRVKITGEIQLPSQGSSGK